MSIRRLVLLLAAGAAFVAPPVASARAEPSTFAVEGAKGSCVIEGKAKFAPALTVVLKKRRYEFTSAVVICETKPATEKRVVKFTGEAEIACDLGFGEPPTGEVGKAIIGYVFSGSKVADTDEAPFEFTWLGNKVTFKVRGRDENGEKLEADGEAEFGAAGLIECRLEGAAELGFRATVKEGGIL